MFTIVENCQANKNTCRIVATLVSRFALTTLLKLLLSR